MFGCSGEGRVQSSSGSRRGSLSTAWKSLLPAICSSGEGWDEAESLRIGYRRWHRRDSDDMEEGMVCLRCNMS